MKPDMLLAIVCGSAAISSTILLSVFCTFARDSWINAITLPIADVIASVINELISPSVLAILVICPLIFANMPDSQDRRLPIIPETIFEIVCGIDDMACMIDETELERAPSTFEIDLEMLDSLPATQLLKLFIACEKALVT